MADSSWDMDFTDISDIFKTNLRIENKLKAISSVFFNERFYNRIDYKPYFQRNYVWDADKATYFIESILLGTEIPPLVLFDNQKVNEVIDGRQRFETINKFINNRLTLTEEGLHILKSLSGKTYSDLEEEIKENFEDTKIRILQCAVVNEPQLSEEKEDKIKKEIFRRYNSGITPLHKEEIQRAEYIDDIITKTFNHKLCNSKDLFYKTKELFLSKRQKKKVDRDIINILLAKIRSLLVLPLIPINNYANSSSKSDVISKAYYCYRDNNLLDEIGKFEEIIDILFDLKNILNENNHVLKDNILLYECFYWGISIIKKNNIEISSKEFLGRIIDVEDSPIYWRGIEGLEDNIERVFQQTGSHYYKSILYRYKFIANCLNTWYQYDFNLNLYDKETFKEIMNFEVDNIIEIKKFKIHKADPTSMTIEDIIKKINRNRFIIRPNYQRSEVTNLAKASYLLESIMLDMKIPPLYIFKRQDGVFEVIDGQQRLLTIIGFLGKTYITEDGKSEKSQKNLFKLKGLKILDELNGKNVEGIPEMYYNRILDFQIDVVEIDSNQNEFFDNIDLFLRLNTKPYPIRSNSFEMWNAYVNKETVVNIKKIAAENEGKIFKKRDTRMGIEELITSLAYLDYKMNMNTSPYDILNIYIRNNRINARIKKKADITKVLASISNAHSHQFMYSVENITHFIKKIRCLLDDEKEKISCLFASSSYNGGKTDQNFYLLWLLLNDYNISEIEEQKEMIFLGIHSVFEMAQNYTRDLESFIGILQNFKMKSINIV